MKAADTRDALAQLAEQIRREHVPDARRGVFEVHVAEHAGGLVLTGHTTDPVAADLLHAAATRMLGGDAPVFDEIVRLPHPDLGSEWFAVARAAIVPVYSEPRLPSPQISEVVLGVRIDVLERRDQWLRIRGEDGYLGWVHSGYVQPGPAEWAHGWERGTAGEPVVSLGADLVDEAGRVVGRAPWGARLIRRSSTEYELPDGARAKVAAGEVVDVDRLSDRFPPRGESVVRTARRWLGAPYLWGGVTLSGVDCSGFTQAVYWMHGIALPRDSDLQSGVGARVDSGDAFETLRAGDLLFFAEGGDRITHVAISLGGPEVIHAAITNGGVAVNGLTGSQPLEERLRGTFRHASRLLPD
jgi:gamma-D-glutamyl-L-lysine dipeptidyl-peptidase